MLEDVKGVHRIKSSQDPVCFLNPIKKMRTDFSLLCHVVVVLRPCCDCRLFCDDGCHVLSHVVSRFCVMLDTVPCFGSMLFHVLTRLCVVLRFNAASCFGSMLC